MYFKVYNTILNLIVSKRNFIKSRSFINTMGSGKPESQTISRL